MKIDINFEGLNKILCKLGLHRWMRENYPTGTDGKTDYKHPVIKFCQDCNWEVRLESKE